MYQCWYIVETNSTMKDSGTYKRGNRKIVPIEPDEKND